MTDCFDSGKYGRPVLHFLGEPMTSRELEIARYAFGEGVFWQRESFARRSDTAIFEEASRRYDDTKAADPPVVAASPIGLTDVRLSRANPSREINVRIDGQIVARLLLSARDGKPQVSLLWEVP